MRKIKVIQIGLGPLGQKIAKYLAERSSTFQLVGAVDKNPELAGQKIGTVCGLGSKFHFTVKGSLDEALVEAKPDVALLTTVSDIQRIIGQIEGIVSHHLPVVSTCEELSFPWETAPALARRIDAAARRNGVAVLGTGVNPGFLMDFLPLVFTAVCQDVKRIRVSRIQNAAFRRLPFQKKIGAGLTLAEFVARHKNGTLRHVGLTESMHMIASRMGWKLTKVQDILTPIIAQHKIKTDIMTIRKGMTAGVQQIGHAYEKDALRIELVFRASVGEEDPQDVVDIAGTPPIISVVKGGINGDVASCAIIINAVGQIIHAPPGLRTMADIVPVSFFK